jgi:glycosyltransferase involved in cell wall biosynthesis
MNLLSIVIPTFNRQLGLNKLLADLFNAIETRNFQTEVKIIVIDDCSTDRLTIPDSPLSVILIRNQKNLGASLSRKRGLLKSEGKFIHFHDSDDSIADDWLEEVIKQLKLKPDLDILMNARIDHETAGEVFKIQKYFHQNVSYPKKIKSRLVYRNCMGPLGGVTFSRRVLDQIEFKRFASCQDWQMYIDALKYSKVLVSRPDIKFIFNKMGDDRISHNPTKKILGHLQLAKITGSQSIFGRNIRLFYLYTCKQHIYNKGGSILKLYKKNRLSILVTFLVVSVYWRIT